MARAGKIVGVLLVVAALLYAALAGTLYWAMRSSPEAMGWIMARMGPVVFALLPLQRMYMSAREGPLRVGDPAPDFHLERLDRADRVSLSSHRGGRPVVLVFGSYT